MDVNIPAFTCMLICPACKRLSFDPTVCPNCKSEIPSSTKINIIDPCNRTAKVNGYTNLLMYTFSLLNNSPSSELKLKEGSLPKSDAESHLRYTHENCAHLMYQKTEEEVKEMSLGAQGHAVTRAGDKSYQCITKNWNSNVGAAASSLESSTSSLDASTGSLEAKVAACSLDAETAACSLMPATSSSIHPAAGFITIYDEDMACLSEGKLNDTIIDSYLKYIQYAIIPPEFQPLTHIFSAFFSLFLMRTFEQKNPNVSNIERSVNRWVKNVDLFSKDFIFVPVNRNQHWFLAVICFISLIDKSPQEIDQLSKNISPRGRKLHPYLKKGKPCICFFDSFNNWNLSDEKEGVAGSLIQFLDVLWKSKYPNKPCNFEKILCFNTVCPQQRNDVDCGLYLLQYVESFFQNPIPYFDNPMPELKNWFPFSIMKKKREQIRKVLTEMRKNKPQTPESFGSDQSSQCSGCDIILL